MKRFIAVLAAVLLLISLVACGGSNNNAGSNAGSDSGSASGSDSGSASGAEKADDAAKSTFPEKDIKLLVPFAAGGGLDITTRIIVNNIPDDAFNGHSVNVECMEGGGGVVGTTWVKNQPADGYTVLCMTTSVISNPMLKETSFTHEDFRPVVMYAFEPELLICNVDAPYDTLDEFVAYAKEHEVTLCTPGHSTSHHMAGIKFATGEGLNISYLHNGSASEQLAQVMGGHSDLALLAAGEGAGSVMDGTVKALGIMNETRLDSIPDVPTFIECGYDYVDGALRGLAVSKDTPDEIVEILADGFTQALTSEECIQQFADANCALVYGDTETFQRYIDDTYSALQEVVPMLAEAES